MHTFLTNNRDELIERCKLKVAQRPKRAATEKQLANGIPLFIDQLTRTLEAEEANEGAESIRISGPPGGDSLALSEIGVSAKTMAGSCSSSVTRSISSSTTTGPPVLDAHIASLLKAGLGKPLSKGIGVECVSVRRDGV